MLKNTMETLRTFKVEYSVLKNNTMVDKSVFVFCKQKIQRIAAKYTETCKLSFNLIFVLQLNRRKRIF